MASPNQLNPQFDRIGVGTNTGAGGMVFGGAGTQAASHASISGEVGYDAPASSIYLSSRGSGSVWVLLNSYGTTQIWTQLTIN